MDRGLLAVGHGSVTVDGGMGDDAYRLLWQAVHPVEGEPSPGACGGVVRDAISMPSARKNVEFRRNARLNERPIQERAVERVSKRIVTRVNEERGWRIGIDEKMGGEVLV